MQLTTTFYDKTSMQNNLRLNVFLSLFYLFITTMTKFPVIFFLFTVDNSNQMFSLTKKQDDKKPWKYPFATYSNFTNPKVISNSKSNLR